MSLPYVGIANQAPRQRHNRCRRLMKMAVRPFKALARPFAGCFLPTAKPPVAGVSQTTNAPSAAAFCPTEGAILVPLAQSAAYTSGNNFTCSSSVLHLSGMDVVPLSSPSPTCNFQDGPASMVTASASGPNRAAATHLCSQADSHQLMSQQDRDYTDILVQTAAAGVIDSIVDDFVEDVLSCHNTATACAVNAVVEQLVSEAICDAQAAEYAMEQRREAARVADAVLDNLISDAAADDAAAQVEVVDNVLDDLISNAVGDVQAALAESLSDLNIQTPSVNTGLELVISAVRAEAGAESAAACQPSTAQRHVREPTGNVSEAVGSLNKRSRMQSTSGAHRIERSVSYSPPQAAESRGGAGRQQVQQLRRDMELLSNSIHLEVYKEECVDGKVRTLGQGPNWTTILSVLPLPSPPSTAASHLLPVAGNAGPLLCVLKLAQVDRSEDTLSTSRLLAQEAHLMLKCAHPNVLPLAFVGLRPPPQPCTPADPTRVVCMASPLADLSLERRLGQEAWGRCTPKHSPRGAGGAAQGPSLLTLLENGKAVLHALAHVHHCGVLHRALTPDHVLLFSKQSTAGARRGTGPAPIKFTLKLGGFGSALLLDGQGCAMDYPPYRCEAGYIPPEAQQGGPLTSAADVHQFGGLCYYMTMGTDPPTPLSDTTGMAEILSPGLMPEEWRALVAACWAAKPQDRPTICHLQHQISSLQQSLRASHAATGHQKCQLAPPALGTGITPARYQAASSGTAAAGGVSQPLVLPRMLQGLEQWMPVPSVVYMPIGAEEPTIDEHHKQGGDSAVFASEAASDGGNAAVHGGRLPPKRGDSARDSFWSWRAGLQGGPGAISTAFSNGIAEVSAKTASLMQQLADTQLSTRHGSTQSAALV